MAADTRDNLIDKMTDTIDNKTDSDEKTETIVSARLLSRVRLRAVVWLALFASVLSLQLWFPRIDARVNDTYNVDNGGRNALFQFIDRRLPDVSRNHDLLVNQVAWLDPQTTLCLLGPARYPSPREWEALLNWVNRGGRLLFAAQWDDAELSIPALQVKVTSTGVKPAERMSGADKSKSDKSKKKKDGAPPASPTAVAEEPAKPVVEAAPAVSTPADPATSLTNDLKFTWKSEGSIEAPGADVLVKTGAGVQAVRIRHGAGTIVLTASDYIFSNSALFEEGMQNGILVARLFEAVGTGDSVVFDEALNETGTPRVVGLLLDPVLRPSTIQIVALIVLFAWRGNRRFGGLLAPLNKARHDVADHTNSLGNLYYKAHHGTGVLREYLEQLKTELRLRYAGADARILQPIALQAGLSLEEVQRRLAEAEAAARQPKLSRREAAAQIRKLAVLRQASRSRREKPAPKNQAPEAK